jgi:hypothetical protein
MYSGCQVKCQFYNTGLWLFKNQNYTAIIFIVYLQAVLDVPCWLSWRYLAFFEDFI